MKKYYYYTFETEKIQSNAVCFSESGSFPLDSCIDFVGNLYGHPVCITFWHEISSTEYELFCEKHTK